METSAKRKASQTRRSRLYIVTIRRNVVEFLSLSELNAMFEEVKDKLRRYGTEWSSFIGYELDKRNVLHLHTYCSCISAPWYPPTKGWNVQLKEFPHEDSPKVIRYITKEGCNKVAIQQRELDSYIYVDQARSPDLSPFTQQ